ncbi:4'-phosphopantetheinyl transferase superfamily protein [Georgenia yuyongxinii]|uniref:4'-phosphopantetheinyl transferase superfamily protein n=1 Tax=Georgenia yuyongxinii TaxID=2589797 RepID=A0A5B8C7M5_9MICO|nr:4'-phosphopantetheinyl transferase superfamily protein [Georgenia yuyongxinii]QDC26087.1 4'-phosphopantetheinyl transferase superfamily protein [Georgenia yuyongxinii]
MRAAREVEIWLLPAGITVVGDELDHLERDRAAALPPDRAARFVAARVLLRRVLSARLGLAPDVVPLDATCPQCGRPHGQVRVDGTPAGGQGGGPQVSVTRSGPLTLVALADGAEIGVDVEAEAAVTWAQLADVALSPAERAAHDRLPPPRRGPALARAWVRKEAVLKALGCGLDLEPARLELAGPGGPRLLPGAAVRTGVGDPIAVALADLSLEPGVAGAVALLGPGPIAVRTHDGSAALRRVRL